MSDARFYQWMNRGDYEVLLKEGSGVYVPDRALLTWMQLSPESLPGIPTTAHLSRGAEGIGVWRLVPMAPSIAAIFDYVLQPVRSGRVEVIRVPKGSQEPLPVCRFEDLYTAAQEIEFYKLMLQLQAGIGGEEA